MEVFSPRRIDLPWPEPPRLWMQTLSFDHSSPNLPLTPRNESNRNRLKRGSCLGEVKLHFERKPQGESAAEGDSSGGRTGTL